MPTKRTLGLAASIAIACSPILQWCPADAADFSHARRTYVPPSMIDRRVDFTALREQSAAQAKAESGTISPPTSGSSTPGSSSNYSIKAPRSISASPNYGIVPPPPAYPSSFTQAGKALQAQAKKIASSPQAQSTLAGLKKKAAELARSGKFDEAKQIAAKALQMSPQDKNLLKGMSTSSLDRAKEFVNSADFDKALQYARQSLAYDGTNPEAKKLVDGLLEKSGINPSNAEERLKSAELLASQGRNDEAFVEYQAASKLKPSADAHIGIGNVALRAGQKDRAKNEYHAAIEIDPSSSAAYRQLGLLKYAQGDVVGANAALSRSLVLNPKDKAASKSLVELWQQQVSRVPGANSHLGLARAYQLSGDLQSAHTEYRSVVRLDPENAHLPAARQAFKLALARQDAERAAEAAHTLDAHGAIGDAYEKIHEAVRLSPGDAELRVYQGQLLEKLQKIGGAREAYLNALKINPHHSLAAERLKHLTVETIPVAPDLSLAPTQVFAAPPSGATDGTLGSAPSATPHDPVANISNFAVALRNHIVTSKAQIQEVEDAAHKIITSIGSGAAPSEALVTGTAAGAATTAAAAASDSVTASVDDALSSATAAIAAAKGGTPSATAAATSSSHGIVPKANAAYKQMVSLKQQNQQLQEQLKKMNDSLRKMRGEAAIPEPGSIADSSSARPSVPGAASSVPMTAAALAAQPVGAEAAFEPPVAPSIARTVASRGIQEVPMIDPSANASTENAPVGSLRQPLAIPNLIRFELENASPKLGAVELSVILRNDADVPFLLPTTKLKAVINYNNRRPVEVKAMFVDAAVPPHGAIRGTVRVPFDKVDPTADLVLPELLPEGSSQRDVHLITSMAFR